MDSAAKIRKVGEVSIVKGPPPAARLRRHGGKFAAAYAAAAQLQPGEWFAVEPTPTGNVSTMQKAWSKALGFAVRMFRAADGRVIVHRRDPEAFLEEEDDREHLAVAGDDDQNQDDDGDDEGEADQEAKAVSQVRGGRGRKAR